MVRMDWFISNLLGGIKLLVKPEDIEPANQILDQPIPEDFAVDGVGEYRSPRCPNCQSLDVIEYAGAFIALPSVLEPIWKCQACGSEWEDTGTGE
jgi:transposase-like protein